MIIACATDDSKRFTTRHFGDIEQYDIYELKNGESILIETILNTTEEEEQSVHAAPNKEKGL